jgi:hypothetical protein
MGMCSIRQTEIESASDHIAIRNNAEVLTWWQNDL